MAKKGLRAWVKENWVDIANKRPDGSYPKCGRSGGEKRKKAMGGGMMMDTPRATYKGGGLCTKGMGRAYGKNS